jgi:uncharacterized protein YjgD (DUF1641 family)
MAEPIPFHPQAHDPRTDAEELLRNVPHQHAEALLSAVAILQSLHDEGVLEIIRGGLGSRDKILEILVDSANTPGSLQGIRNLIILAKLAGTLDPKILEGAARAVPEGLADAGANDPIRIWDILKRLCSQDTRRALLAGVCMLQAIGKALKQGSAR